MIPESVTAIWNNAFENCSGFTGSLTIPAGVKVIGGEAFADCAGIGSAVFGGDAPTVGDSAFGARGGDFVIYYIDGKSGWITPTWNGYACRPKELPEILYGDVDGSGVINLLDVVRLRQYIHPSYEVTLPDPRTADADGNGKINLLDVVRLRQYIHPSYTVTLGPQIAP